MDGQMRAYVWAQVMASKLSIHGLSPELAAQDADAAVVEFDKRTFSEQENNTIDSLREELAGATAALKDTQEELALAQDRINQLGATVESQAVELAERAAEVIAPAPVTLPTSSDEL